MKVLFIQKMAGISGSERYFLSVLPKLREHGVDVAFLLVQHPKNTSKNAEFIAELRGAGVPVHRIDSRFSISPWVIWKIAQVIREHGFDVVQSNLIHADVWIACVKRLLLPDLRVFSLKHGYSEAYQTSHGLDPSFLKTDLMSVLTRWAGKSANRVGAISFALESFLVRGGLVESSKSLAIPYGFDFSTVLTEATPGALRFGTPQIVVAGRLVPVKQHHLLLRILPSLVRVYKDLSVVMVGAGPLLEELKRETIERGLSRHVRWEGFRRNMHDYIRDSDVMVIPSAAEGFGLVVLEAWYHGKPVVAFDVPAVNEIIESGVDGELVAAFDTKCLQDVLDGLLSDPERCRQLGENGRRKQIETYGLDSMCEKTIAVYREMVSPHA